MESKPDSYWHTPLCKPFTWKTLPQVLQSQANAFPDKEVYVVRRRNQQREAITYQELHEKSNKLATFLVKQGLVKGDAVVITGITCMNWIICDYACMKIGVIPLKSRMSVLTKEGIDAIVNENSAKALLFHPGIDHEFEGHLEKCFPLLLENQGNCQELPTLQVLVSMADCRSNSIPTVDNILSASYDDSDCIAMKKEALTVQPDDTACVYMTSGSTGSPKATPKTHFAIVNSNASMTTEFSSNTRYFNDRSLCWIACDVFTGIMQNICMVYVHPLTSATDNDFDYALQVMKEEKCNMAMLLQYMIKDMLNRFDDQKEEPFYLEWAISGGEILQYKLFERASKYVKKFIFGYGSTEAMGVAVTNHKDTLRKQLEYAGRPAPGVEIKIIDSNGLTVPIGSTGEICVRSPYAFKGYLHEKTDGALIDKQGWIHIDDAGLMTEDGYIKVLGRMTNVISRGITITHPSLVEQMLMKCDSVSSAAVVGVPDERLGEEIAAFVIPKKKLTEDELVHFFNEQYQTDEGKGITPGYFFIVDEFPLNANGKVDVNKLKSVAIEKISK